MILDIAELSGRNPWWRNPNAIWHDEHIQRALDSQIHWRPRIFTVNELERNAVYTLRGPRQVGKTTSLKFVIAELLKIIDDPRRVLYLSCDPLDNLHELRVTLLNYLRWARSFTRKHLYIVLDEVTRIGDWQVAIKDLVDHNYLKHSVIVACGSHSLDVRRGAELLPGRRGNYVPPSDRILYPMSFKEFVGAYDPELYANMEARIKDKNFLDAIEELRIFEIELEILLNKYMVTGGFPAAVSNFKKSLEKRISIHPYNDLKYYINGDIMRAKKNPEISRRILNAIIDFMGEPVSINKIARKSNCDPKTAQDYIFVLESMFVINTIPFPDIKTWRPLERKRKKLYLLDPFLLYVGRHMIFEDEDPYELTLKTLNVMKPKILELMVASHLRRLTPRVFYWRTSNGKEVDFVVPVRAKMIGIEIKETPRRKDTAHTLALLNRIPRGGEKLVIITGQTKETLVEQRKIIVPIQLLLYVIDKLFSN